MNEVLYQNLPIVFVLGFILIPLIIGSFAFKNSLSTVSDFFLYNRSMGTTVAFFTVYATWWSSFAFLGSISYFYSVGSVYWTGIAWNVLFGILYLLIGRKICHYGKKRNYITPISFFSDIYASPLLNILVIIIMLTFSVLYLQIQLYGGAIILEIATKGLIPWRVCAMLFYVVMIIYLWAGGLRAVAWTDVFYGILIFFGMLAGGLVLSSYAGGIHNIFETLAVTQPELIILPVKSATSGIPMWISMFLMLPLGELMSPQMWTRIYATKEQKTFYIMPFLLSLVTIAYLGSMLAGSAAAILKPDVLHSSDAILPSLLLEYAPGWIMAIIMCCGAAACLSTANSGIHSISSLLALDVYKKYINPAATENNIVLVAKVSIVAFSTVTYLVLAFYKTPGLIVNTGFIALSGLAQLIVPVLGALIWHKSNSTGAIWGLLAGVFFTLIFSFHHIPSLPLSPGVIAIFINAAIFILCGLLLPGDKVTEKKIRAYRRNHFEEEQV